MTISFPCDNCGHRFDVDSIHAGKKAKCKKCSHILIVPTPRSVTSRSSETHPAATSSAEHRAAPPRRAQSAPIPAPVDVVRPRVTAAPRQSPLDPFGIEEYDKTRPERLDNEDPYFTSEKEPSRFGFRPRKKGKSRSGGPELEIPAVAYWALLGIYISFVILYVTEVTTVVPILVIWAISQFTLGLVGGLGVFVSACREGVRCVLMIIFIPFYVWYYMFTRWQTCQPWVSMVCTNLLIYVIFVVGIFAGIAKGIKDPDFLVAAKARAQAGAKNGLNPFPAPFANAPPANPPAWRPDFPNNPPMNFGPGPGPGFGQPPGFQGGNIPAFQPPPADATRVEVTGLDDEDTREAFKTKFEAYIREYSRTAHFVVEGSDGSSTYRIWPIDNVHAFAQKINFAKVIQIKAGDRLIQLAATPEAPGLRRPKPNGVDDVAGIIFDLNSSVNRKQSEALAKLNRLPPNDRRDEVAKAVEPLIFASDLFVRIEAVKVLGLWGDKANTKALIAALADSDGSVRKNAIESLGKIKDPTCAEAVAIHLRSEKEAAGLVLRAIGPEAEPAVLKCLTDSDVFTRTEACKILAVIGTDACVLPLQQLLQNANGFGFDADAAKQVLDLRGEPYFPRRGAAAKKKAKR